MAFTFKLEYPDGTPADPPTLRSAVPNWEIGDKIPLAPAGRSVRRWAGASETPFRAAGSRPPPGLGR
jgi:hypothetical protein